MDFSILTIKLEISNTSTYVPHIPIILPVMISLLHYLLLDEVSCISCQIIWKADLTISQITEDCSPLYHRIFDNGNPHFTGDALGFVEKMDENARQMIYGQMRRFILFLPKR